MCIRDSVPLPLSPSPGGEPAAVPALPPGAAAGMAGVRLVVPPAVRLRAGGRARRRDLRRRPGARHRVSHRRSADLAAVASSSTTTGSPAPGARRPAAVPVIRRRGLRHQPRAPTSGHRLRAPRRPTMDRMSPLDAAFLDAEDSDQHTSMAIASFAIFEGPAPSYDEFFAAIAGRLPIVKRYRQKVRRLPLDLGRPAMAAKNSSYD